MRILVNARFLLPGKLEGIGLYTYEIIRHLVNIHPGYKFILCVDSTSSRVYDFGSNVSYQVLRPPARHPFLFIWWFEIGIPWAYQKHRANLFFSPDGFCSLSSRVNKTLLVVHDLAYLHYPYQIDRVTLWYYRKFTPRFLNKADYVISVSEATKGDLILHFPEVSHKVRVVYNGIRTTSQSDPKASDVWKKDIIENPYFMVLGSIHPRKNIMGILEAFEIFKKSDKKNTCLLIVGRLAWKTKEIQKAFRLHPFRGSIILTGYLPDAEMFRSLENSVALLYISFFEGFGLPIVEAMSRGIPVITSDRSSMPEIAGEAALLVNPDSPNDIADSMTKVSKDPILRRTLIEAGLERSMQFSWNKAADSVGEIINSLVR